MHDTLSLFIMFFAVIDPLGTIPVFIAVTAGIDDKLKRQIAIKAFLTSLGILLFFLILGELVLTAMEIPLANFQISGGIILFLFALTMVFGESKPEEEMKLGTEATDKAIFPLAIPSIASPGAILSAMLLTENSLYSVSEQSRVALIILVVLVITLIGMLLAGKIFKIIGNGGASILSRVMGMILSAVALTHIIEGLKAVW